MYNPRDERLMKVIPIAHGNLPDCLKRATSHNADLKEIQHPNNKLNEMMKKFNDASQTGFHME